MANTLLRSFVKSFRKTPPHATCSAVESQSIFARPPSRRVESLDTFPQVRHIVQAVSDLARKPLTGLRVLDLACAHGGYSLELAALGAQVLGIEGRAEWLARAHRSKRDFGLANVDFVQDDVRNLSRKKYGEFDIVLCLGILYHIDAPEVFDLVHQVAEVCRDFAIVETHFATQEQAYRSHHWRGRQYFGASYLEHASDATHEQKLSALGASLDNEISFWFTKSSLCNILGHVGFTSVYEVRNPVPNLYAGPERAVKIWGNRVTLACIKGRPVRLSSSRETAEASPVDWPENPEDFLLENILTDARPLAPDTVAVRSPNYVNMHVFSET